VSNGYQEDRAAMAAHEATGEDTPLEASTGWLMTGVVLVGAGIAAPGIGVCAILYVMGTQG
jgi:hypothetical protein